MTNRKKKSLKINTPLEEVTSNLPFGIIENILSRLPVKSLLRFKSVSKPWYSLISDSKFARVHLQQSINSDYKTIIKNSFVESQTFTFLKVTSQNFQIESLEFPTKKYREAKVLCSCDGLVLLKTSHRWDRMYVLWNPATRTYKTFSCPYKISLPCSTFGLCYDESNDDYKVVYINRKQLFENKHICYAVFSYKNNSWIEEKDSCLLERLSRDPGLFVSGALHWVNSVDSNAEDSYSDIDSDIDSDYDYANDLAYKCSYGGTYEICCFDPRDDKFKKLSKPGCFDISSLFKLSSLRGQLSICRYTHNFAMVEIWTMKEYGDCNSWTKLLTIENVPANRNVPVRNSSYYVKPLCLTSEGNYVLEIFQSGIVIYSPKDNKFDKIKFDEILVLPSSQKKKKRRRRRRRNIFFDECPEEHMRLFPLLCWIDSLLLPSRINETKRKQSGQ